MSIESKIRKMVDDNENFLGEELDPAKEQKLKTMQDICDGISKISKHITTTCPPISEREQNGAVILDLPEAHIELDHRVAKAISALFSLSDFFCTTTLTGGLRLTFIVHDMWTKHSYINDLEHNPEEWTGKLKLIK